MSFKLAIASFAAGAITAISPLALAQTTTDASTGANAPVSREQRKAETAAANKAGQLTRAGEGPAVPPPSSKSTMTREQRKAQTRADQKAGKMVAAGEGPQAPTPTGQSTMTREERKAQARADQKAGKMTPAGEGLGTK